MFRDVKKKAKEKMEHTIDIFKKEIATVRTGRASISMFEGITVDYYGTPTPITQVATFSIPESRLIVIQPWEQRMIPEIEKAIQSSSLGLTPTNDGKIIRIPIPPLTEERRKELVKIVKKMAEDARVAIRNVRREANEEIKKKGKEENISEDDVKRAQDEIQKLTNEYIERIDEILEKKEEEIMEV